MSRVATKLLVDLPEPLAKRLSDACDETGATKMGIVRLALGFFLRQSEVTESEHFVVKLAPGIAETFGAYREIQDYPDRVKLIEAALTNYIRRKCEEDPSLDARIDDVKKMQARKRIHQIKSARAQGE